MIMNLEDTLACIEKNGTQQILPIIQYINTNYPTACFDEYNSEKTHIPTWRLGTVYVGIGCRKHYISIYFNDRNAVNIIKENTPYCRALKGCVNFSYKRALPLDAIYKGIQTCFN